MRVIATIYRPLVRPGVFWALSVVTLVAGYSRGEPESIL